MPNTTAFDVVADYVEALARRDNVQMDKLRAADFVLDFVYADAFAVRPMSGDETRAFWPAWFVGFPEMDFVVSRSIAAADVVVVQWTFIGTQAGPLNPPVFEEPQPATGRTVRFRGLFIYDVADGLIQRETAYIDLATIFVELGVRP